MATWDDRNNQSVETATREFERGFSLFLTATLPWPNIQYPTSSEAFIALPDVIGGDFSELVECNGRPRPLHRATPIQHNLCMRVLCDVYQCVWME